MEGYGPGSRRPSGTPGIVWPQPQGFTLGHLRCGRRRLSAIRFVVSHPFRGEAAQWMGHGHLRWGRRSREARMGIEVSHPFRGEAAQWMGHGHLRWGRRSREARMGIEVSHPLRDEALKWMGRGDCGAESQVSEARPGHPAPGVRGIPGPQVRGTWGTLDWWRV